jgi:MSHA pilin protein MshD
MFMTRSRQHGFTLIELIIFIVVVSAGLAGILSVMNTVVKSSADPMVRKQTIAIAESLLEEILLKDFANPPGGYTGATRSQFDNVGDYAGYTTTGIVDMLGATVPGLGGYNISPPVAIVASTDLTGVAALRVTVSVTDPTGNTISLTGYRTCDLSPSCPLP